MKSIIKKILISVLACLVLSTPLQVEAWRRHHHRRHRHHNSAITGFGILAGTMIGAAAASERNKAIRAKEEALRAQTQNEQLRREQLMRNEMGMYGRTGSNMYILISFLILLFLIKP